MVDHLIVVIAGAVNILPMMELVAQKMTNSIAAVATTLHLVVAATIIAIMITNEGVIYTHHQRLKLPQEL